MVNKVFVIRNINEKNNILYILQAELWKFLVLYQ